MRLEKPDKETALKYDYMILLKNGRDWKEAYRRSKILLGENIIEQGNMDDFEYYKTIFKAGYQYYLIDDEENVIGRAQISSRGDMIDIQYIKIENDVQHKGYGKKMIELMEQELFQDSKVSGICMEDVSQNGETSAIAIKLGYVVNSKHDIYKANPNYKEPEIDEDFEL